MNPNTPNSVEKNTKPKWLKKLEKESWQAELLISGAAVFGSLQLPELIARLEIFLLLHVERFGLYYWDLIILYLHVSALILIIVFVFHLIIRALWIGLVGLNSVYPDGFKETDMYSLNYLEQAKAEYGNMDSLIKYFDRLGSSVFGHGFTAALAGLNVGFICSIGLLIIIGLHEIKAIEPYAHMIAIGFIVIILLCCAISGVLNMATFRDKEWVQRYQFLYDKTLTGILLPINSALIGTITYLTISNSGSKKSTSKNMIFMMIGFMALGFITPSLSVYRHYFNDEYYHKVANETTLMISSYYADESTEEIYFAPVIPSQNITNNQILPVWIPIPKREKEFLLQNCSAEEASEDLTRREKRRFKKRRVLACAEGYIQLKINDIAVRNYDLNRRYFPTDGGEQFGVEALIIAPNLQVGKNILTVTTKYPDEDTGADREAHIPFYFSE